MGFLDRLRAAAASVASSVRAAVTGRREPVQAPPAPPRPAPAPSPAPRPPPPPATVPRPATAGPGETARPASTGPRVQRPEPRAAASPGPLPPPPAPRAPPLGNRAAWRFLGQGEAALRELRGALDLGDLGRAVQAMARAEAAIEAAAETLADLPEPEALDALSDAQGEIEDLREAVAELAGEVAERQREAVEEEEQSRALPPPPPPVEPEPAPQAPPPGPRAGPDERDNDNDDGGGGGGGGSSFPVSPSWEGWDDGAAIVPLNGGSFTADKSRDPFRASQAIYDDCRMPGLDKLTGLDVLAIRVDFLDPSGAVHSVRLPTEVVKEGPDAIEEWILSIEEHEGWDYWETEIDGYEEY